jgi:hypothetical protein
MNPDFEKNLIRLRRISNDLYRNTLGEEDRKWLSQAIFKIYEGIDPYLVLEIEADKGQRREVVHQNHTIDLAMHLVACLIDKEYGGEKTSKEAIEIASTRFGLKYETLARHWYDKNNKAMQSVIRDEKTYD